VISTVFLRIKNATDTAITKELLEKIIATKIISCKTTDCSSLNTIAIQSKNVLNGKKVLNAKKNLNLKKNYKESMEMDSNLFDLYSLLNADDNLDWQHLFDEELPSPVSSDETPSESPRASFEDEEIFHDNLLENELFPQLNPTHIDFDMPDLTDLPLEDFVDLENLVNELDSSTCNYLLENSNSTLEDDITSCASNDITQQNSPDVDHETQLEYKELLDAFNEEGFINSFLDANIPHALNADDSNVKFSTEVPEDSFDHSELFSATKLESDCSSNCDVTSSNGSTCVEQETVSNTSDLLKLLADQFGLSFDNVDESESCVSNNVNKRKIDYYDQEDHSTEKKQKINIKELDKSTHRRIKNNEASKVTRARRKAKHQDLFEKANILETHNAQLKVKIELMQKEANILRDALIAKLSTVKPDM